MTENVTTPTKPASPVYKFVYKFHPDGRIEVSGEMPLAEMLRWISHPEFRITGMNIERRDLTHG